MKHFRSLEEIQKEPGYEPDNPIDLANYQELFGIYSVAEGAEIQCCVRKPNGNRCKTKHRKGWVPRLTNGSITVIGGTCAKKKFGTDSKFSRDATVARKVISKEADLARLKELLEGREKKQADIRTAFDAATALRESVAAFQRDVGDVIWNKLVKMARSADGAVRITGTISEQRDDAGEITRERRTTIIVVGRLSGLEVCQPNKIQAVLNELRLVANAFRATEDAIEAMRRPPGFV